MRVMRVMRVSRRIRWRGGVGARILGLALLAGVLGAAGALAGCGSAASNEVDMGVAAFQQSSVAIKAGQAVHFVDPASGGTHVICVGANLKCAAQAGAPGDLSTADGLTFNTGDSRDIVFPTAGTYNVICTIHPGMEITVTVS